MSKGGQKSGTWQRPVLGISPLVGVSPEALWAEGQAAEEAYDFEGARDVYRRAAASAPAAAALDFVTRYAEFLCERFGQFDEVAAWLDDPAFGLPGGRPEDVRALAALLARAAAETHHPRQSELDRQAAELGDPAAQRRRHAAQEGAKQAALSAAVAALGPLEGLLQSGDLSSLDRELTALRPLHGRQPPFLALESRLHAARRRHAQDDIRRALQSTLAAGDLGAAEGLALRLVAEEGATAADRQALAGIRQVRADRAKALLWQQAQSATDGQSQLAILVQLADTHGVDGDAPTGLSIPWQLIQTVAQLPHALPLGSRLAAVQAWQVLATLGHSDEYARLEESLHALPEAWASAPLPRQIRERLRQHAHAERLAAEAQITAQVEALLREDDLDGAALVLDEAQRGHGAGIPTLKTLRAELSHLRHERQRLDRLRRSVHAALESQDILTAQARLAELAASVQDDETEALRAEIEKRAGPLLRAKSMPPGLQKLKDAALLTGVGCDRLVVVQDTVWLTINLATGGIQPYALPDGWPVEVHAWTRVGAVGDRLRLVGVSRSRLVVIEQVVGQPPQVIAGVPLAELLADDDTVIGAALSPEAPEWVLLSRNAQKGTSPSWTRVDARTLAVLERKKAQPKLASVAGVDGQPEVVMTVAAPKHRSVFAMAIMDLRGEALSRFSGEDVGEPIADVLHAQAWPEQGQVYARYSVHDAFVADRVTREPSLIVIKQGRIVFASQDLRRRFAPLAPLRFDHAWTLDRAAGRLWLAAVSTDDAGAQDALLVGVDARTLRADKPVPVADAARILALHPVADGAVALVRQRAGGYALTRAIMTPSGEGSLAKSALQLTSQRLPL